MLLSEFQERTGVNLTGEEYAKVEHIYTSVQMDKDDFCRLWLENRDNQMIAELMHTIEEYESAISALQRQNAELVSEQEQLKTTYETDLRLEREAAKEKLESFARQIVCNVDDEARLYDILEEEFTLDFTVKVKLEEDIPLEKYERDYLVGKLKSL